MKTTKAKATKAEKAAEKFDKLIEDFKKQVDEITELEKLKELAAATEKEADAYDKKLTETEYDLPEEVQFEGKTVNKDTIMSNLLYFLGHQTMKYEYVFAMHQTYQFWKQRPSTVPYKVFDSLVRFLTTLQFTGDKEWTDILAINAYFGTCVEQYQTDLAEQMFYAKKFNILEERGSMLTPVSDHSATAEQA